MSLINEALKRAQHDKSANSPEASASAFATGAQPVAMPAVTPPSAPALPPRPFVPMLANQPIAGPARVAPVPRSEPMAPPPTNRAVAPVPAELASEQGAHRSRTIVSFLAGSLVVVVVCLAVVWMRHPQSSNADLAGSAGAEHLLATDREIIAAGIAETLRPDGSPAAVVSPAVLASPVGRPAEPASSPIVAAAPATRPAESAADKAPAPSQASRFTLGGIMRIGGGSVATINGKLLRVGENVDGGTVLAIEPQSVDMECNGERFTLRIY